METKKNSLFIQDVPGPLIPSKKPRRKKSRWKQEMFHLLFKGIEVFWILLQIIQSIGDFFKR